MACTEGMMMSAQNLFARFSHRVSHFAGRPVTFALACGLVLAWAVSGPLFGFSETWQLVINTATTIVTFLMVFVLQNTQERDGEAVQAKLDELIVSLQGADNRFVAAERLTDKELHEMRTALMEHCERTDREIARRGSRAKREREPV
jgi:low affinity Fe/Cu permease